MELGNPWDEELYRGVDVASHSHSKLGLIRKAVSVLRAWRESREAGTDSQARDYVRMFGEYEAMQVDFIVLALLVHLGQSTSYLSEV